MQNQQIIRQNASPYALPDFRSLGVLLRAFVFANGMALFLAMMRANSWPGIADQIIQIAAPLQPVLLSSLLLLYVLAKQLARQPYWRGHGAVIAAVAVVTLGVANIGGELYVTPTAQPGYAIMRAVLFGAAGTAAFLAYYRLRAQALSPAKDRARLQALQARIRPHFLFNCINTVLSMVRSDPRRAETALEDMSDLFRMAMAHDDELVLLKDEVELSRRYLELEQLRLGDRLKVAWHAGDLPADARVPPLILQPLLENAVYHGIEPLAEGGAIDIRLELKGGDIRLEISNPRSVQVKRHAGNKLALDNIRERLSLLFDIEAQYAVESRQDFYSVRITMPYVKGEQQ